MSSPEERQVTIFLRKYNLEQIENLVKSYQSSSYGLEEESRRKAQDTLAALSKARSSNAELNADKEENGRLTAKRIRLQRECNEIINMTKKINEELIQLEQLRKEDEINSNLDMCQYDIKLQEVLNEYRHNEYIYDEELIKDKTAKANEMLTDLLAEGKMRQNEINTLKKTLDDMKTDVPKNIVNIMGHTALEEKLNSLTIQCEVLRRSNNI